MFLSVLTTLFLIGVAGGEVHAIAAPLLRLPNGDNSTTILVCVVSELPHEDVEVVWVSHGAHPSAETAYSILREWDGSHRVVSMVTVASSDWESFVCFVRYREQAHRVSRHYVSVGERDSEATCFERQSSVFTVIQMQTDAIFILALRIILLKTTIFNVLMTTGVLLKLGAVRDEPGADVNRVQAHSLVCRACSRQGG